jgi:type IV pilus assembly protein PilW
MNQINTSHPGSRQTGLSMIELLVALAIGSFLIIGAVTVQSNTRKSFDVGEQQARLQENARFVLATLEPDLQMAGVYGYTQDTNAVMWDFDDALTAPKDLRMTSPAAPGLPESLKDCGDNFVLDVLAPVTAINGKDDWDLKCDPEGGGQADDTDALILRHSAPGRVDPDATKLQVFSERRSAQMNTRLFISDDAPDSVKDDLREVRDMVVQAYYISKDSDGYPGVPALRVKFLTTDGASPVIVDRELIRGVEDLQVQFGIDPGLDVSPKDGKPDDPGDDGMADLVNGYAQRYVNAGDALLSSAQVVSVRVWVRVRADHEEPGFTDNRTYEYADTKFAANDHFRRLVLSRTIFLRNSRQL